MEDSGDSLDDPRSKVSRGEVGESIEGHQVDVGIPTHGRPRYLRESVESVLAQSLQSWRLTISENGPGSDEIRALIKPYLSDPRVRHITVGTDVSGSQNATRSISQGTAPFVAVLHDDDKWDSGFLEQRATFLAQNPTCGFVFSNFRFIDARGRTSSHFDASRREGVQPRNEFLRSLYRRNFIGVPTVLSRRSAFQAVGSTYSDSVLLDDYLMWLRLASRFDVGFLDVDDAAYRIHSGQKTELEFARMGVHRLDLLKAVDAYMPTEFPEVERRRARASAHLRGSLEAVEQGELKDAAREFRNALAEHPGAPFDLVVLKMIAGAVRHRARQRSLWHAGERTRRTTLPGAEPTHDASQSPVRSHSRVRMVGAEQTDSSETGDS